LVQQYVKDDPKFAQLLPREGVVGRRGDILRDAIKVAVGF
jgi:hypothetical protein